MTDTLSTVHHLLDGQAGAPGDMHDIYRSSNGDTWQLVREGGSKSSMVRHTANPSSGGNVTDLSVEQFLAVNGHGPEHAALRVLLGTIAGSTPSAGGTRG